MLSKKRSKKQDNTIQLSNKEQELIDLYNKEIIGVATKEINNEVISEYDVIENEPIDIEEYTIYDGKDNEEYEEYQILLDEEEPLQQDIIIEEKPEEKIEKQKEKKPLNYYLINKIINIVFIIIMILLLLTAIDVILVGKYEVGPFFAIPVKTYKDGGSKTYYGFGYKVIKYNQKIGRRDKVVGTYSLKYNTTPVNTTSLDLAIEFTNNENESYKEYYKKFVRVTGELTKIDNKNNKITISYLDEDGKYSLDIICSMARKTKELDNLELNKEIVIIGTVYDYDLKTQKNPTKLYIKNCFAEQ